MAAAFTTAIEAWDKRWATPEGRADWLDRQPHVIALLPELKARGARTALDLGCGVGRHALFLAEHGLAVEAIDGSAAGLAVVRETARARGISLGVRQGTADALPFDDGSFDFVLSWKRMRARLNFPSVRTRAHLFFRYRVGRRPTWACVRASGVRRAE